MTEKGVLSSNLSLRFLATLLLTTLYGIFLWDSFWGLGFFIIEAVLASTILFTKPETNNKQSLILLGLALVLSAFIPFRVFEVGRYLTFFLVFVLNCLAVTRANSKDNEPLSLKTIITVPLLIGFHSLSELAFWPFRLKDWLLKKKSDPDGINQNNVITGILIAIPLLALFTILLSSADPVFERYLSDFFSQFSWDFATIKRIVEIIFFFGIFSAILGNKYTNSTEFNALSKTGHFQKEIAVAASLVVILLGMFLVVQGRFLFAGENLLSDLGLTLSEYTRRGYGQLLIVSSISLLIIYVLSANREKRSGFLKVITSIYILEIFLLLLSATYRVYLYQDNFGLTQARVLGILFSIWLAGALGLSVYRFLAKTPTLSFFYFLFMNTVLVTFLLHLINIDYTVAAFKKPNLGVEVDHNYILRNLSSDAWSKWDESITYLEKSADCSDQESLRKAGTGAYNLLQNKKQIEEKSQDSWHYGGSWTLSDAKALEYLEQNSDRLNRMNNSSNRCLPGNNDPL